MTLRYRLDELEDAVPTIPGKQAPSGAGSTVDELFYGARSHLQQAQKQLHDLLELLQNGHQGVDSAPVADCYKATAESIDTMDQLAKKWQEEAEKLKSEPGSLNAGRSIVGDNLTEALDVISRGPDASFDDRQYVKNRLFFDRPTTLDDMRKHTSFEFDRFLDQAGDDE